MTIEIQESSKKYSQKQIPVEHLKTNKLNT